MDVDIKAAPWVFYLGVLAFVVLAVVNFVSGSWPGWWTLILPLVAMIVIMGALSKVSMRRIGQIERERPRLVHEAANMVILQASAFKDRDTSGQWWDGHRWRQGATFFWDEGQWKSLPAHQEEK